MTTKSAKRRANKRRHKNSVTLVVQNMTSTSKASVNNRKPVSLVVGKR